MGHGEGPGGSSGFLDLFAFKRYLRKKITIKMSIVTPALGDDTHLPACAARLVSNFFSKSIFFSEYLCVSHFGAFIDLQRPTEAACDYRGVDHNNGHDCTAAYVYWHKDA